MMGELTLLEEKDFTERLSIDQNLLVSVALNPNIKLFIHLFLNDLIKALDINNENFVTEISDEDRPSLNYFVVGHIDMGLGSIKCAFCSYVFNNRNTS